MSSNDVRQQNFESESGNSFEIDNKELLDNLNSQLKLNYFPSDQTKHIDYVIFYTEKNINGDENSRSNKKIKKRKAIRFKFFDDLKSKEGFEIERIVKDEEDDETSNYMLLNCPFQRLLQEAERMSLVLPLKNLNEPDEKESKSCQCCVNVAPDEYDYSSAPFEEDVKFLFRDFEIENSKCKGFSDATRSLLVDNILKNMMFDPKDDEDDDDDVPKLHKNIKPMRTNNTDLISRVQEKLIEKNLIPGNEDLDGKSIYSGLPYMLEKEYFNEAFILHEESNSAKEFNKVLEKLIQETPDDQIDRADLLQYLDESKKAEENLDANDARSKLTQTWSSMKNIFRLQPLWNIREYFGEYVALYYAFCGVLITSLWLPSLAGITIIVWGSINVVSTLKANTTASTSDLASYYINVFEDLNDTYLLLPFAALLCLWGILSTSYWNRKQNEYSYEWDTKNYETFELDRVQYTQKLQQYRIRKNDTHAQFSKSDVYCKKLMSFLILFLMIGIVALQIAAVVVYRIYTAEYFKDDSTLKLIVSTVGSSVISAIFLVIMGQIYLRIAVCTTEWENPRTQTEFNDSLVFKIFAFEFVNNYGSLYYAAFVRLVSFSNGFFGLGSKYNDTCSNQDCMRQVTLSVLINLLVTPLSRLFSVVIIPAIKNAYSKYKIYKELKKSSKTQVPIVSLSNKVKPGQLTLNQFREYAFVSTEQKKDDYESSYSNIPAKSNIRFEYMEKVTLYGYVILFGSTLSLSPFIFLMILLFDIRVDANSILWGFRRPVSKRAEDIGTYQSILTFLNIAGIVTNSFLIAFTSYYYKSFFSSSLTLQFLFIILYEHGFFIFWLLIAAIPLKSSFESYRLLKEQKYVNEMILTAKETVIKSKFSPNNPIVDQVPSSSYNNYNNVQLPEPHIRQRSNGNDGGYEMNYNNVQPRDKILSNNNRVYPAI